MSRKILAVYNSDPTAADDTSKDFVVAGTDSAGTSIGMDMLQAALHTGALNLDVRIDSLKEEIEALEDRVLSLEGSTVASIDIGPAIFEASVFDIETLVDNEYQIDIGPAVFNIFAQTVDSDPSTADLLLVTDFDSGWISSPSNTQILLYETTDSDGIPPGGGCDATKFSLVEDPDDPLRQVARLYAFADNACLDFDTKHRSMLSSSYDQDRFWLPFDTEIWLGCKIYCDSTWPDTGDKNPIFNNVTPADPPNSKCTGWMQILPGTNLTFRVERYAPPAGSSRTDSTNISVTKGAWHTFTVRTRLTSDTSGYYYLWVDKTSSDDTPDVSWTGVQSQGNPSGSSWEMGIFWGYNVLLPDTDLIMYVDYMRMATGANGFDSVQP